MTAKFGGNNCSFDEMDVSVESIRMKLCFPLIWHRFLNALQYEKSNALENVQIKWKENDRKKLYSLLQLFVNVLLNWRNVFIGHDASIDQNVWN